mmetsp:Transcript_16026/g.49582  ORF Transcript_16026/g.49582 Transcript_16026/m.49582 type:complete len:252 (-) Transcript_16026:138-893(-)
MHAVSVLVEEDLDLQVLRALDELLHEDPVVAERGRGLARAARKGSVELALGSHDAHAAAAAARRGFEHHGERDVFPLHPRGDVRAGFEGVAGPAARGDRHAELRRERPRADLVAERLDGAGGRADPREARGLARGRERRAFGQEAVAGMHERAVRVARGADDGVDVQVRRDGPALRLAAAGVRADRARRRRARDVRGRRVLASVDGHALEALGGARARHAQRDLSAICYEHAPGRIARRSVCARCAASYRL